MREGGRLRTLPFGVPSHVTTTRPSSIQGSRQAGVAVGCLRPRRMSTVSVPAGNRHRWRLRPLQGLGADGNGGAVDKRFAIPAVFNPEHSEKIESGQPVPSACRSDHGHPRMGRCTQGRGSSPKILGRVLRAFRRGAPPRFAPNPGRGRVTAMISCSNILCG